MDTVAINFSRNNSNDVTNSLLSSFIDGLKETGNSAEIVNVCSFDINPCKECTKDLLFESPGFCKLEDDMQIIYPKLNNSDLWIFALSIDNKDSVKKLKNVLDRLEPLFESFSFNGYSNLNGNGKTNRKSTKKSEIGKIILIATSEQWDLHHFDYIIENILEISTIYNKNFIASILRPHAWVLTAPDMINHNVTEVFNHCIAAGIEMGTNGFIAEDTLNEIRKQLIPKDSFTKELTHIFQQI